jgi:arabinogalactan endo-1,4-beta-galactosidase
MTANENPSTAAWTRRGLLGTAVGAALAVPAGLDSPATAAGGGRRCAPSVRGADLSFTLQLERAGVTFSRHGRTAPVERLLRAAGGNWVRLRVWVNPPDGYSTLESAVRLGRRAKRAGLKVLLDLHYSDFWADPAHQATPEAWQGQDLGQLADTVRRYTAHALETMDRAGARVDQVQIGNEITSGMLWPLGEIYASDPADWDGFTTLLKACVAGARGARVHRRPDVMVHVDRGGDNGGARWFYDHVLERGVEFDTIGLSYYPFWHGPLEDLQANLADLAGAYGKPLVVAETAYPWTLRNGDDLENHIDDVSELPDADRWPATPAGQADYFRALRAVFATVPSGLGRGFFTWEPEWVPGVGWTPGEGNPNDNLTLFDFRGRALPALDVAYSPGRR